MNEKLEADEPALGTTESVVNSTLDATRTRWLAPLETMESMFDSLRQFRFPPEFRIARPYAALNIASPIEAPSPSPTEATEQLEASPDSRESNRFFAEVATCLWYLKTKHFKQSWDDDGTDANGSDGGPRVRRAIGRLNRGINALRDSGIEIEDPTNKRYPPGGEGMMRPLQFQPTDGLTFEKVTETVTPIVYRQGQLIQRGEVFVAVPKEDSATGVQPAETGAVLVDPQVSDHVEHNAASVVRTVEQGETKSNNALDATSASVASADDVTNTENDRDSDGRKPHAEKSS